MVVDGKNDDYPDSSIHYQLKKMEKWIAYQCALCGYQKRNRKQKTQCDKSLSSIGLKPPAMWSKMYSENHKHHHHKHVHSKLNLMEKNKNPMSKNGVYARHGLYNRLYNGLYDSCQTKKKRLVQDGYGLNMQIKMLKKKNYYYCCLLFY